MFNVIPDKHALRKIFAREFPNHAEIKKLFSAPNKIDEITIWAYAGFVSDFMLNETVETNLENLKQFQILSALSTDFDDVIENTELSPSQIEKRILKNVTKRFPENSAFVLTENPNFSSEGWTINFDGLAEKIKAPSPIRFLDLETPKKKILPEVEKGIFKILMHGKYVLGPEIMELEGKLCEYTESEYCIAVSSGTDALSISLLSLGVGPGDEVITSPFTFAATVEVIVNLGAIPIFVDIEYETCNINPSLIEAKITPKTKAIIPVSLYGQPSDMDEINQLGKKYDLPVIEDASQSFGATYKNRKSCNLSTIGCTSFYPSKPLGTYGEGGAVFTNDSNLAEEITKIRHHGQTAGIYNYVRVGVNGRLDSIQCAVLMEKLKVFDSEIKTRKVVANWYDEALFGSGIKAIERKDDRTSAFALYTIFVDNRNFLRDRLMQSGIPTSIHYPKSLTEYSAYASFGKNDTPLSEKAGKTVLSLPFHPYMKKNEVLKVVSNLKDLVQL